MNITIVAGTRPNFMKIAPIIEAIAIKKSKALILILDWFILGSTTIKV
jgi:UDP-N-acetylglucosamine 2-epimerase (non-hydrolysing)